ncbi:MAG: hypothetical protein M3Y49_00010 [Actinomycetota bacterium]|nr:hypothetical protein [Actinomycetota bacterium]
MPDRTVRFAIGGLGILAAAFGFRWLWDERLYIKTVNFAEWLIGGVLLQDVVIANVLLLIGWLVTKALPAHIRGFVHGGLIVIALSGSMAFFVIWRQGTASSPGLALLSQNYVTNFAIIIAVVVAGAALFYATSLRTIRKSRPN